tara:strand:- start:390 stop:1556 length:1167 start_codon:yes stop_codon:yes gene_type:complete
MDNTLKNEILKMEKNTLEHWHNQTLNYDIEKYNFPKWALGVINEIFPQVKELESLHKILSAFEVRKLQQHVQNACARKDFMEMFDAFLLENISDKIEGKKFLVQRQGTLRVVIPNQASQARRLFFHQGIFVGNGRGCRTIWTPFTTAKDTNTMWIMDLDKSREITKKCVLEKWSVDMLETECKKHAKPVNLEPGQSHLFFQELLHGNVNNEEGYTRVSLDMRILLEGEEFGRRYPGGFMRAVGDYETASETDYSGKKFITYAGWNSKFAKPIPLPFQRAIMEPYCVKNKIEYTSYEFENEHCDWQPALEQHIRSSKVDGIVLCSIYCLTDDVERRNEILHLALEKNVELHFANELCSLKTKEDLERINFYLGFAVDKKGDYVWETNER